MTISPIAVLRDINQTCEFLDQQDAEFVQKMMEVQKAVKQKRMHGDSGRSGKSGHKDEHSLQGKHGKTHGVC